MVCTGAFAIGLGIFLIILNSFISRREESELEDYVQRQLTRSRSGHRLERDVETGGLATRSTHKSRLQKDLLHSPATESSNEPLSSTNTHDGELFYLAIYSIISEICDFFVQEMNDLNQLNPLPPSQSLHKYSIINFRGNFYAKQLLCN